MSSISWRNELSWWRGLIIERKAKRGSSILFTERAFTRDKFAGDCLGSLEIPFTYFTCLPPLRGHVCPRLGPQQDKQSPANGRFDIPMALKFPRTSDRSMMVCEVGGGGTLGSYFWTCNNTCLPAQYYTFILVIIQIRNKLLNIGLAL